MTPSSSNGGEALPTPPPTESDPKPKAKRRAKRTRLLTAATPQISQDRQLRIESSNARTKYAILAPAAPVGKGGPVSKGYVLERRKTIQTQAPSPVVSPVVSPAVSLGLPPSGSFGAQADDLQNVYPSSTASWYATNATTQDGDDEERERNALMLHRSTKIIQFEDTTDNENLQTRLLREKLLSFHVGNGVDPFRVLPQFKSPELDSVWLLRKSGQSFRSTASMEKWISRVLFEPHLMLSSTILASTWLDMREGLPGDSKRTGLAKAETMSMINDRLRHPVTQLDDGTLIVIHHLLAGEVWSCNEKTIRMHEAAIARLIAHRGGVQSIKWDFAIEVIAANIHNCNIFSETDPLPIFRDWQPTGPPTPDCAPESPLYCPGPTFTTIVNDPQCSLATYELLCNMRDLTNIFTANPAVDIQFDLDIWNTGCWKPYSAEDGMMAIRKRLASLPSAYTPGLPTTNDWIYETCRITALIYTGAIVMRIPFAAAADPSQNPILFELGTPADAQDAGYSFATPLTEVLYEALERTATLTAWSDMCGVFYWVCAVGAAAARNAVTINMIQRPRFRSEVYTVWIRRSFVMFSLRTVVLLVFKHTIPTIMAQKKLLRVQGLIRASIAKQSPD